MKILLYTGLGALICVLGSCIPSLHGLVTPENAMVNDAILGSWSGSAEVDSSYYTMPPKTATDHITLPEEVLHSNQDLIWEFERAVSVKGIHNQTEVGMNDIALSMVPEAMQVLSKQLLSYYILTHREIVDGDTVTNYMKVEMTEINTHLLLDFTPYERNNKNRLTRFATNYVSAHTFAKIIIENGKLTILPLHGDFVYDLIQKKRIRLRHELIGDNNDVVLTATTPELRAFIANYSQDPNLFDDPDVLLKIFN